MRSCADEVAVERLVLLLELAGRRGTQVGRAALCAIGEAQDWSRDAVPVLHGAWGVC